MKFTFPKNFKKKLCYCGWDFQLSTELLWSQCYLSSIWDSIEMWHQKVFGPIVFKDYHITNLSRNWNKENPYELIWCLFPNYVILFDGFRYFTNFVTNFTFFFCYSQSGHLYGFFFSRTWFLTLIINLKIKWLLYFLDFLWVILHIN